MTRAASRRESGPPGPAVVARPTCRRRVRAPPGGPLDPFLHSIPALAVALLLSLAFGRAASRLGVPRVTVYLLVGLALGPHGLLRLVEAGDTAGRLLLGPETRAPLHAVEQLAIGFILLGIGGNFRVPVLRRVGPRILSLSVSEILLTGVLVAAGVWIATGNARLAAIAPALAISTAPMATLVTLREVDADGPASRSLILCVGLNNLTALLAFPLLLALAFHTGRPGAATALAGIALLSGLAVGLVAAVSLELISGAREQLLLGILVVFACLGLSHWIAPGSTGLGMLACFAAGLALANGSPHGEELFRRLEAMVHPLYVLFFIGSGRDLRIETLLELGGLGVVFIAARTAGKVLGTRLGLRVAGWDQELPRHLGAGLLSQAGVALGLLAALEVAAPEATADLRHVVLASVVFFELLGPWLVRQTVVGAGEVKLANLLPHAEASRPDALRWVVLELRRNLGAMGGEASVANGGPTVRHAMRRRPHTVGEALPFDRVLKALGEGGAELVPVVDGDGQFRGVISFDEVKNALYDPVLRDLVIAEDLATEVPDPLGPNVSLAEALELMDRHQVHSWPVVEEGRLLGLVRRPDVYALMRRSLRGRRSRRSRGGR